MSQLYDPDLTQWLQLSGEYIAQVRPAEERSEWVMFLLAEIKVLLPEDEYATLLKEVQGAIQSSLTEIQ